MLFTGTIVKVGLRKDCVFPMQGTAEKKDGTYHSEDKTQIPAFKQLTE